MICFLHYIAGLNSLVQGIRSSQRHNDLPFYKCNRSDISIFPAFDYPIGTGNIFLEMNQYTSLILYSVICTDEWLLPKAHVIHITML